MEAMNTIELVPACGVTNDDSADGRKADSRLERKP